MSELNVPVARRAKKPLWVKILIGLLIVIVLLVATVALYANSLYQTANDVIDKIGTPEMVPVTSSAKVKPLTFLLLGVDSRPETGSINSDVIMGITLNPQTKSATVVSVPRDLEMEPKGLPSRKANYYFPYFHNQDQQTAFAKSKELYSDFFQVPIDYMVTIDFMGFQKAIDELGGLTINVDMDMRYVDEEDGTNINLKKGVQQLNGKQTLDFVRYRKSNRGTEESSDFERNKRQQQVLDQMIGKLATVGGLTKLGDIMEAVGSQMKTDIPASQIRDMMKTYYNIDRQNVKYMPIDGEWVSPFVLADEESLSKARAALRQEAGLPDSTSVSPSPSSGTSGGKATATPKPTHKPTPKPTPRQGEDDNDSSSGGKATSTPKPTPKSSAKPTGTPDPSDEPTGPSATPKPGSGTATPKPDASTPATPKPSPTGQPTPPPSSSLSPPSVGTPKPL